MNAIPAVAVETALSLDELSSAPVDPVVLIVVVLLNIPFLLAVFKIANHLVHDIYKC